MREQRNAVTPIDPKRIRKIRGSFSWIDHRFIRFMDYLSRDEILFYLWLTTVGDRNGVSFYSNEKTAGRLKMSVSLIEEARAGLVEKRLIAYRRGVTQVLALPDGYIDQWEGDDDD